MNLIALRNEMAEIGSEDRPESHAVDRLDEIDFPMLVLVGALDDAFMIKAGEYLADHVAGAQHILMPGTAHLPMLEQPDAFNRHVLGFLAGIEH